MEQTISILLHNDTSKTVKCSPGNGEYSINQSEKLLLTAPFSKSTSTIEVKINENLFDIRYRANDSIIEWQSVRYVRTWPNASTKVLDQDALQIAIENHSEQGCVLFFEPETTELSLRKNESVVIVPYLFCENFCLFLEKYEGMVAVWDCRLLVQT